MQIGHRFRKQYGRPSDEPQIYVVPVLAFTFSAQEPRRSASMYVRSRVALAAPQTPHGEQRKRKARELRGR